MPVDLSKIKFGDRVRLTLTGQVEAAIDLGDLRVVLTGSNHYTDFLPEELDHMEAEVIPEPLKVGDRVTAANRLGEVRGVEGDYVWIKFENGKCSTYLLSQIERLP